MLRIVLSGTFLLTIALCFSTTTICESSTMNNIIRVTHPLKPQNVVTSPFLFCVYHKDFYPAGNERMEAPKRGNGADFNPSAAYRMYHGDRIPGFPQVILRVL